MSDAPFVLGRKINENVTEFTLPEPITVKRGELITHTIHMKDGEMWLKVWPKDDE